MSYRLAPSGHHVITTISAVRTRAFEGEAGTCTLLGPSGLLTRYCALAPLSHQRLFVSEDGKPESFGGLGDADL